MWRTRLAQLCPQGGTARRVVYDLAPGPLEVVESQSRISVARPSRQGLGNFTSSHLLIPRSVSGHAATRRSGAHQIILC